MLETSQSQTNLKRYSVMRYAVIDICNINYSVFTGTKILRNYGVPHVSQMFVNVDMCAVCAHLTYELALVFDQ